MKAAISRGAKYLAVDTTPSLQAAGAHALDRVDLVLEQTQPLLDRLRRVDEGQPCGSRTHAVRRCGRTAPGPTSSSTCLNWIVTAGGERPKTLAALTILPWLDDRLNGPELLEA